MTRTNSAATALGALVAALAATGCGDARPIAGGSASATSACGACHGYGETASTLSGAHAAHLAVDGLARATCADCHRVPTSLVSPGHQDGHVDLVFGARAGGEAARYDVETGTCAVACHGVGLPGGPASSPAWRSDGGAGLSCTGCHAAPPPAPHPAVASCGACHAATVAQDGSLIPGGAHLNGRIDVPGAEGIACGTCHSIPPAAPHPASTDCGSCHDGYTSTSVVAATHQNGRVDVRPVEQMCGACHGIPPPAPHTSSTQCGSCHPGYTSASVDAANHRNGRIDVSSQACGACHGIPPSTGQHRKHVVDKRISCGSCHAGASATSGGAGHMNGTVDVAAPGWNPSTRSCANSCHGGEAERWSGGG